MIPAVIKHLKRIANMLYVCQENEYILVKNENIVSYGEQLIQFPILPLL